MPTHKAVFLDKDGTLIVDFPYNVDPARIVLSRGMTTGLKRLMDAGYCLVVVSNQSGVAQGYFGEEALRGVMLRLLELLNEHEVRLSGFYYCPHHPHGEVGQYTCVCDCRKPKPGLLQKAARELQIDLEQSWMVGDILDDVEAGHRAGCRSVLIDNGNETKWQLTGARTPDYRATDVDDAAEWILRNDESALRQPSSEDAHACKSL